MSDIYSAPEAELSKPNEGSQFGSVENGIAGNYELKFGQVLSEAWGLVKGFKGIAWGAFLLYMVVAIGIGFVVGGVTTVALVFILPGWAAGVISQVAITVLMMPLAVGFSLIAIARAGNKNAPIAFLFNHFNKVIPITILTVLMYLMILVGFVLLVLPGIYLAIAYIYALPLMVEKGLSPWEALEASRKAITKKWFTVFFLFFVLAIIVSLAFMLFFIPAIWAFPWAMIAYGIVYRNAFGIENTTLEQS